MRIRSDLLHRVESVRTRRRSKRARILATLVALLFALAPFAYADDDLPGRVGRVAEFAGQLYLSAQERPAEWSAIGINYPITSGDNLWVSSEGRAELDYGGGQLRLDGDTNLQVSRLDDRQLTLFVARGQIIARVRVLDTGDTAVVDTPGMQVALARPGLYRIAVTPDGQTTSVMVREGEAVLLLATGSQQLLPGQAAAIVGPDSATVDLRNASAFDGFDAWSANRDRGYERGRSTAYVSKQMVGYAELDEYGTWDSTATYGPVWYPNAVPIDWAPYRDGYWTNAGEWGLTWVDAAPWGYAPSHYGRWVQVNSRWAWCPGAFAGRPRWAPALVGWYGGAGWGLTADGGAPVYGWVPLGWGDAFQPWWRGCSNKCWARYNEPFAVNAAARPNGAPARYSHMAVPGAMTSVAGATLLARKPVAANRVPVPASQTNSAPLLATAPTVAPGSSHNAVFRPGERGTPTPASMLPSYAIRARTSPISTPGSVPSTEHRTVAVPAGSGASIAGAPSSFAREVRSPPASATLPSPAATSGIRGNPISTATPSAAVLPPGQPAIKPQAEIYVQPRHVAAPAAQTPVAASPRPSNHSAVLGPAGLPLPMPATPVPVVGAVPTPTMIQVAPAVAAPVVLPVQIAPAERPQARPSTDADTAKGGKGGDRNPVAVPAVNKP